MSKLKLLQTTGQDERNMSPLVSPSWLNQRLADERIVILDASIDFQIPSETEKDTVHTIPNARRFDYDKVFCDLSATLPHMMPNEEHFNSQSQALGINNDSIIVVYDNSGTFASPRAWWMLKAMGHQEVYVLDGGLTEWKMCGLPLAMEYSQPKITGNFSGKLNQHYFVDADYVLQQIDNETSQTIDARSKARFNAQVAEPRAGIRSGHIPNSACLPFAELMIEHKMKCINELEPILKQVLKSERSEYLFSCGSGVTACIVLLAAYVCGYEHLAVYDGSWTEWGQNEALPISQ